MLGIPNNKISLCYMYITNGKNRRIIIRGDPDAISVIVLVILFDRFEHVHLLNSCNVTNAKVTHSHKSNSHMNYATQFYRNSMGHGYTVVKRFALLTCHLRLGGSSPTRYVCP